MSYSPAVLSAACAHRSVPFGIASSVMTTSPPAFTIASRIRSSSVATTRASNCDAFFAWRYVRTIIGFPAIITSGFPGNLVDAYRAGMTPRTFVRFFSSFSSSFGAFSASAALVSASFTSSFVISIAALWVLFESNFFPKTPSWCFWNPKIPASAPNANANTDFMVVSCRLCPLSATRMMCKWCFLGEIMRFFVPIFP